jgi:uncharacterized membrane protein/predicted RNA-binding Zn-ribbon protein involved in translation (DUF1610 family)
MNLHTSKLLGGIGALLIFLSIFLSVTINFGYLSIIGVILILISLYSFTKIYKDKEIFNNALFGTISAIIGSILSVVIVITTIWPTLKELVYQITPEWNGEIADLANALSSVTNIDNFDYSTLLQFTHGLLLLFIIAWVFLIITMFFLRRSLKKLATHSDTNLFATTGLILLISAALAIIGLGLILLLITPLLLAIAFFTIKEQKLTPPYTTEFSSTPQHTPTPTNTETKLYCPQCGASILPENFTCPHCGKQI